MHCPLVGQITMNIPSCHLCSSSEGSFARILCLHRYAKHIKLPLSGLDRARSSGVFPSCPLTLNRITDATCGTSQSIIGCLGGVFFLILLSRHNLKILSLVLPCFTADSMSPFAWLSFGGECSSPTSKPATFNGLNDSCSSFMIAGSWSDLRSTIA